MWPLAILRVKRLDAELGPVALDGVHGFDGGDEPMVGQAGVMRGVGEMVAVLGERDPVGPEPHRRLRQVRSIDDVVGLRGKAVAAIVVGFRLADIR